MPEELGGSLGITLVVAFSKCGAIGAARKVSFALRRRSVLSWTAMISAYVDCNHASEALNLYYLMEEDGIQPNSYTYVGLFKACGKLEDLELGRKLHADARRNGFASDSFVGSTLVSMYSKLGAITDAEDVFSELSEHDIVTWTAMLSAYVEDGQAEKVLQLYRQMQEEGLNVDHMVYVTALKACSILAEREEAIFVDEQPLKLTALEIGQAFHADADKDGFTTHTFVGTALLSMYGKCGAIKQAEATFGAITHNDVVSWRAMLSVYVELGQGEKALSLYTQMQGKRMSVDALTYVIALQACAILGEKEEASFLKGTPLKKVGLDIGEAIVADVQMNNFASDSFIGTALVTMYAKCGTLEQAEAAFCGLSQYDVVSWTAMLSAYVEKGHAEKALQLFSFMQYEGVNPDQLTFMTALQACASLADKEAAFLIEGRLIKERALEIGRALLADAGTEGFASDFGVNTNVVSMFGKCGAIKEAEDAFLGLSHHSITSWNAILSAYVEYNQADKAAELYEQMQKNRIIINDITFVCALRACHKLGSLELCKQVHFHIVSAGFDQMPSVVATLLHAYGSCGSMADAQALFDKIHEHDLDVVSWNAYISAYAGGADFEGALHTFEKMKRAGATPNEATFNAVLLACDRAGFVAQGVEYFESMINDYGISPDLQHYGIVLDLLGRAGDFKRIENMLESMPMQAPMTIWLSILGACRTHGNVEMAKVAFDRAVYLQPKLAAPYILMSNICTEAGLQQYALEVQHHRQKNCG